MLHNIVTGLTSINSVLSMVQELHSRRQGILGGNIEFCLMHHTPLCLGLGFIISAFSLQCSQHVGPRWTSSAFPGNCKEIQVSNPPPASRISQKLLVEVGPSNVCHSKFSRYFWCLLKFECLCSSLGSANYIHLVPECLKLADNCFSKYNFIVT